MAKDVLITPASGLIEFKDNEGNVDSSIQLNDSNVLVITGTISLGDLAADVYIGDGVNEVDIVYEQNGGIYGLAGKTLTLGLANSYLSLAANVTSGANITGNLLTGGQVVATGNVTSSGNVSGTYLLGNVFYATGFSASKIYNGTSQINIGTSGGAANISIGGTSNVAVFSSTGVAITGDLSVSGNATLSGNILGDRLQNGTTSIDIQTASGNANISVAGTSNVVVFSSSGQNVAGYITSTGNISGSYILGNGSQLTGLPALYGNSNVAAYLASGLDTANIVTTGNISGGNILGNGRNLTGINTFSSLAVTGSDTITANSIATALTFTGDTSIVVTANSSTNTVSFAFGGAGDSIFSTGGTMGLVDEAPLTEEDLGLVTDAVTEEYDLGGFYIDGFVGNDNFLVNSINGNILAANAVITTTGNITGGNLITAGQVVSTGAVYSNFNTNTANTASFNATGGNTKGGTGYLDFLVAQNTSGGATNPFKWFRTNSTGGLEIINSAYNNLLLSLTDAGALSVASSISVAGKKAVNGPAFRASIAVGQTITSGTQQKVTFGTETFDTDGNFASSRFTPTTEGYYQLNSTVRIAGGSSTGEYMLVIWKNGAEYSRGSNGSGTEIGASFYSLQVSDIAYANGSTDYFEIYIQQTSGSNKDTTAGAQISYFSGVMVRGA
jgi:hypothetical protein